MLRSGEVGLEGTGEPTVTLFGEFGGKDALEEARDRLWGLGGGTGLSEAIEDRPEATEDLLLALKGGYGGNVKKYFKNLRMKKVV